MRLNRARLTAVLTALLTVLLLAAGMLAGVASAQPARSTALAGVPWSHVGPGWTLTQYTTAPPENGKQAAPLTLYLISPGGVKYRLASWPDYRTAPQLLDWSADGERALFQDFSGPGSVGNLTLATGRMATFRLPKDVTPIGYTTPRGLNIVGQRLSGQRAVLARYDLSGRLTRKLGTSSGGALYEPSGHAFVTSTSSRLELVSNDGNLIRKLAPVPGTEADSCGPVRWWDSRTVLASCSPKGSSLTQLWLVPAGGGRPTALTPRRSDKTARTTGDLGDLDAWSLSSGLYLQSAGPCGVLQIFRQARNGSISLVKVPHTQGDNHVLTALGARLLVQAPTDCTGSNSLLWFNPGTHAEQWLIRAPSTSIGVMKAVPFYSRQNSGL